jgi:ribosomal protein S18 acetylase RimI-like enzyme
MNDKEINMLLEKNFVKKIAFYPSQCDSMNVIKNMKGIIAVNSLMPSDTFNVVTTSEKSISLSSNDIESVINIYRERKLPFAWWLGPQALKLGIDNQLERHGMYHAETEYSMAISTELLDTTKFTYDPNFKIEEAKLKKDFIIFGQILSSVFDPIDSTAVSFYEKIAQYHDSDSNHRMFIGYCNGKPVSIASIVNSSGFGGIYDIVTHPDHQRKGFARMMTQYCIESLIKMKCDIASLLASEDGFSMYKKIGFKELEKFKVFALDHCNSSGL